MRRVGQLETYLSVPVHPLCFWILCYMNGGNIAELIREVSCCMGAFSSSSIARGKLLNRPTSSRAADRSLADPLPLLTADCADATPERDQVLLLDRFSSLPTAFCGSLSIRRAWRPALEHAVFVFPTHGSAVTLWESFGDLVAQLSSH